MRYRSIIRLHHKHLFGTLQLCFGWRVGLAPYSTEVEHVHENRYRGAQHVTLNYLLYTTNVYIIITLD